MGLFRRAEKCATCRTKLPEEARFCPQCARPAKDVYRRCPRDGCDGIAKPDDAFCPRCGSGLPAVEDEVYFDVLWDPPPGELARRFRVDTEEQAVEGAITVRYAHQGLLLGDGALLKRLDPGVHPVETTFRDLQVGAEGARRYEVVELDTGEHALDYAFAGLPTQDGVPCMVDLRLAVEVRQPERLLAAFMKNAESVTAEGLRLRVRDEVRNAVEEGVARWPAIEIAGERHRKDELAGRVGDHMRRTFEALGFTLVRVETLDARVAPLDEVRKQRVARAVDRYEQDEAVAQATQDAQFHEQKAAAWARLRESVQRAEMDDVADKAALQDFLRKLGRETQEKDWIRDSELDALTATLSYKKEDRERARQFVLLRLDEEQGFELDRLAAKRRLAGLEGEIEAARKAAEAAKERASGETAVDELRAETEARTRKRREMFGLDVLERRMALEYRGQAEALRVKSEVYRANKRAQAEASALKLRAAGEAGLQADQIAALFAEEQPQLADALTAAFAGRGAEERAALERRHAQELRQLLDAAQQRDAVTMRTVIDKLSGALGAAVGERAFAGDREAQAVRDTVGMMRGEGKAPARKRCRVCHCEWLGEANKCPSCSAAVD